MKNVLFATTALVAMAGAANAAGHIGVSFGGDVEVGYADSAGGMYAEGGLTLTGMAEFDYGVSVEVTIGADLYAGGGTLGWDAFPTVTIMTERLTLTVGDVEYAAVDMFNQLDGMNFGNFPDEDVLRENQGELVARVDATLGDFEVGVSIDAFGAVHPANAVSVGVAGTLGSISFTAFYDQAVNFDADANANTDYVSAVSNTFGVSVGAELGQFSVDVAYMSENNFVTSNSIGVEVGATMGSIELAAYYAMNSAGIGDNTQYGVSADTTVGAASINAYWDGDSLGGSNFGAVVDYAVSDAITASVGYDQGDSWYVAAVMAIADGAEVGAAYSDAGNEYDTGINLWFSADF